MNLRMVKYLVLLFLGLVYFETRDAYILPRIATDNSFEQVKFSARDPRFGFSKRIPAPKQRPIPISNQMVIKEKRKGFADRGKEYTGFVNDNHCEDTPVFSGPICFYSRFIYRPRHLDNSHRIRPPPVC